MLMGCGRGTDRDRQGGGRTVMHGGGWYRDPRQFRTLRGLRVDIKSTDGGVSCSCWLICLVV